MNAKHKAAEHHASAAHHHMLAAKHHRAAATHYQVGKDHAHAAHQALIARGHALHAMHQANEARKYFAEQHSNENSKYSELISPALLLATTPEILKPMSPNAGSAGHHAAAADHHEQASRHHAQASKHWDGKDYARAAQEAQVADGHTQHSVFHGDEAAMCLVEHYGKAEPIAELA